jgi:hypothetical protein
MTFRPDSDGAPDLARDPVVSRLVGRVVDDVAEGYRVANDELWRAIEIDERRERVAVDESLASEILALHLADRESPVARLLFDAPVRDAFCDRKRELIGSALNLTVNRAEPDFLWYRKGHRLVPVVLRGRGPGASLHLEGGEPLPVPYQRAEVARALSDGTLWCDRILAYAVRCLFPGIVAVGGTSQQDYVHLYQRLLLDTHGREPFLDAADLAAVADPGASRLGGAPLLEDGPDQDGLGLFAHLGLEGAGADLRRLERSLLDRPLGETVGQLSCASYFEILLARREARIHEHPGHQ